MTERRYAIKSAYVKMNYTERYHFFVCAKIIVELSANYPE